MPPSTRDFISWLASLPRQVKHYASVLDAAGGRAYPSVVVALAGATVFTFMLALIHRGRSSVRLFLSTLAVTLLFYLTGRLAVSLAAVAVANWLTLRSRILLFIAAALGVVVLLTSV